MNKYCHQISGFFPLKDQAEIVYSRLVAQGINQNQLRLHRADFAADYDLTSNESSNNAFASILLNVAFGVAIGSITGMLIDLMLLASNNNVFEKGSLITPTVLLGWCAGLGGLIGLITGSIQKRQLFAQMAEEAVLHGQFAIIVETYDQQQTAIATSVIKTAAGSYKNVHNKKREHN